MFQAAVRSSRRKRNQYVVGLREEVKDLKRRRKECQEENQLLRQLHGLWARLVQETERELQAGVHSQINSQAGASTTAVSCLEQAVAEAEVAASGEEEVSNKTKVVLLQQKEVKSS